MAAPQNVSLPPFFTLTTGMVVQILAVDTNFGSPISGVILSSMALSVDQEDADTPSRPVLLDSAFLPSAEQVV